MPELTLGRDVSDNAGYGYYMPLLDVDLAKAKRQYEVNVWGVLAVTQAFFPLLRIAKGTEWPSKGWQRVR